MVIALLAAVILLGLSSSVHAAGSLIAPTIAASPGTIDVGQNETLSANGVISGGTAPYTCQWWQKTPGSSFKNFTDSLPCSTTPSPVAFDSVPSAGNWKFELIVTDSSTTPEKAYSVVGVTVYAKMSTPTVSPSAGVIDIGQSITTLRVSWSGGTAPWTVTLYNNNTSACGSSSSLVPGGETANGYLSTAASFTYTPSTAIALTANEWYCAVVTDSAGPAVTVSSTAAEVVVNPTLKAPVVATSGPSIDLDQNSTLSIATSLSGGTSTYTCQWLQLAPAAKANSTLGKSFACTTSSVSTVSTGTLATVGIWKFSLSVIDSASTAVTRYSNYVSVTVSSPLKAPKITIYPKTMDGNQSSTLTGVAAKWLIGGTSPYTCQWLVEAPGATKFGDNGSSSTCTPAGFTRSTGRLSPGSWSFEVEVTDGSAKPESMTSKPVIVKVMPPLGTPTLSTIPAGADIGRSVNVKVTWAGGLPKYTIVLYSSLTSSCGSSTPIATVSGRSASSTVFKGLPPISADTWYCAKVTDSSAKPVSSTSAALEVIVSPQLVAGVITATPPTVDKGQSSYLYTSAAPSGGMPPYTCQWLKEAPGATKYSKLGTSFSCSSSSLPFSSTGAVPKVGAWNFELETTDANLASVFSKSVSVTFNPALVAPTITVAPSPVSSGQNVTLSMVVPFSGGTGPYTCQVVTKASGGSYAPLGSSFTCTASSTLTFSTTTFASDGPGQYYFRLYVTDSSGVPVTVASQPVIVDVS